MDTLDYSWHNKHIVFTDDDYATLRYFEVLLKNSGAKITTFTNGQEVVDYCSREDTKIDLMVMDLLIPYISGIDATRIIRKNHPKVPIIMLTGYYTRESKEKALLSGCNEFYLKPILPEKFLSLMAYYLEPVSTISKYART